MIKASPSFACHVRVEAFKLREPRLCATHVQLAATRMRQPVFRATAAQLENTKMWREEVSAKCVLRVQALDFWDRSPFQTVAVKLDPSTLRVALSTAFHACLAWTARSHLHWRISRVDDRVMVRILFPEFEKATIQLWRSLWRFFTADPNPHVQVEPQEDATKTWLGRYAPFALKGKHKP